VLEVQKIRPGLWVWRAPHPEWKESSGWPRLVASTYYEAPEATVVIDPLVPDEAADATRFWDALDLDVERRGLPVATLLTVHWHERSCAAVRERYPAYHGHPPSVTAFPLGDPYGETVYWLPDPRALVPGDILLGTPTGGLRVCPPSWYDGSEEERRWYREGLRPALDPLLALDVEMVLCSHWDPVLEDGAAALRAAVHETG
jgi:glyoxylase-like metal-dependent hydrolase (beta-lactamase superfamily II)